MEEPAAMLQVRHLSTCREVEGYVRYTAELRAPDRREEIWWLVPDLGPPPSEDWLVSAGLIVAMARRLPLRVRGRVSPTLLASLETVQEAVDQREHELEKVPVEADTVVAVSRSRPGVTLSSFSLGLDSLYTNLAADAGVQEGLYMHGFEAPQQDQAQLFRLLPALKSAARELERPLRLVETNYWTVVGRYCRKSIFTVLPAIFGASQLMSAHVGRLVVPANHDEAHEKKRWASLSTFIPAWSSEHHAVCQHGTVTRIEKVRALAPSDLGLRWVRVCWAVDGSAYNCGRCPKCIRTLVNLELAGAAGRCPTLPGRVGLREVARMPIERNNHGSYVRENLDEAEHQGRAQLAVALRTAMRREDVHRPAWVRAIRTPGRMVRRWGRSLEKRRVGRALARHRQLHPDRHLFQSVEPVDAVNARNGH